MVWREESLPIVRKIMAWKVENKRKVLEVSFKLSAYGLSTDFRILKPVIYLITIPGMSNIVTGDMFYYNTEYKILICKYYSRGIVGFERHRQDVPTMRKKSDR
jgi:hypothetical protein